jgi:uncharacterized protein YhfF/catechol 2,3-dioxygenase-like lactoylglutathione lyase family enzyme
LIFNHVTLGARDLVEAGAFYDAVLAEVGLVRGFSDLADGWIGYGPPGVDVLQGDGIWLCRPIDGAPASVGNGATTAFRAPSRAAVRAFHTAALANGGACDGPPGLRDYHPTYFGTYVRDPTGNKICAVFNGPAQPWDDLNHFRFGDALDLATRLAALVVAGRKRATVAAATIPAESAVGQRHVVTDGACRPVAIIETTEYAMRRFDEIDAAFAADEGEGDLSLAFWQAAHRDFFTRNGGFAPDMTLWAERFRLVEVLDAGFAAGAQAHVAEEIAEAPDMMRRWGTI